MEGGRSFNFGLSQNHNSFLRNWGDSRAMDLRLIIIDRSLRSKLAPFISPEDFDVLTCTCRSLKSVGQLYNRSSLAATDRRSPFYFDWNTVTFGANQDHISAFRNVAVPTWPN